MWHTNMNAHQKPAVLLWTLTALLGLYAVQTATSSSTQSTDDIRIFHVRSNESLTATLEEVQEYLANGSGGHFRLRIANGMFDLTAPNATALATFVDVSAISIVGAGEENTTIDGRGTAGFVFLNVSFLTISNITFRNCSSRQNSTTTNTSHDGSLSSVEFSVALYLLACSHVHFESVSISKSYAAGLAMYNVHGTNIFTDSTFSENTAPPSSSVVGGDSMYGGGGVILEFSYCSPGDVDCNGTDVVGVSDASFNFSHCLFDSNVASSIGLGPTPTYPHGKVHAGLGRGGGMEVYFGGRATNNTVTLSNCNVTGNGAQLGGGIHVEFGDESKDNVFNFTSSNGGVSRMDINGQFCGKPGYDQGTSGGGVKVVFVYYPPDPEVWPDYLANVTGNHVEFRGTYITANMACWGGGVALVSSRADPLARQTNTILFTNCTFRDNQAVVSAALDISVLRPDTPTHGQIIAPVIEDCVFCENEANTPSKESIPSLAGYQFGGGAVYIDKAPANFTGVNTFTHNIGAGLVVSGAVVFVSRSTSLRFEGNKGKRGGALILIGGGSMVTYPGANLSFLHNEALEVGGAIYAEGLFGEHDFIYKDNCFIRYYQPTVHPRDWKTSFIFADNRAAGEDGNSTIYVTSLLSCVWPDSGSREEDINQALCWQGWVYDGRNGTAMDSCAGYVSTSPGRFNTSQVYEVSVYPGHKKEIPVTVEDDYGETVRQVVYGVTSRNTSIAVVTDTSRYITNNKLTVYGVTNSTKAELLLDTLGPRIISAVLKVTILPCPPGYSPLYDDADVGMVRRCKCGLSYYFSCDMLKMSAHIRPGVCIRVSTPRNATHNSNFLVEEPWSTHEYKMVVVNCPATAKQSKPILLPSCNDSCDLDEAFCGKFKRTGQFCSACVDGYAVDVNDINNCVQCSDEEYRYGWFLYILTNLVPITLFFIIVALFKISATSAPMYAFVFFAQITTVRYFHNQFPWIYGLTDYHYIRPLLLVPYCIWNLDFFIFKDVICLSPDLNNMYSLLLKYLLAFYPMLLILLSYICIELYDRNFRLFMWMWKPFRACLIKFRRSWQPKTSIIDAFATFLVISYTKIVFTTISLLTPARQYYVSHEKRSAVPDGYLFYFDPQYRYFKGAHLAVGLTALVVGVVFVLLPPTFLLLYPTRVFQRCLNKWSGRSWQTLHTFADAFQGCFKNRTNNNLDYRYFAGLYFVLRIVILMVYAVELSLTIQLLLQQVICVLAVLVFALVKPYKEPFFNKVDLTFFSLLSIMNIFSFSNFTYSRLNGVESDNALLAINYALGFLPLVYISVYVVYLLLKWRGVIGMQPVVKEVTADGNTIVTVTDDSSVDVPDRFLHPENYQSNSPANFVSTASSAASSSSDINANFGRGEGAVSVNRGRPSQRATEGSYFLKRARKMNNYSSI